MNEEELIKKLFEQTELKYSTEGIEEAVFKKIKTKSVYRKRQQRYAQIGKIGMVGLIILSVIFILILNKDDTFYFLGLAPFVLLLMMFPFEVLLNQKTIRNQL